jgi:short-subunit dehydrogenase
MSPPLRIPAGSADGRLLRDQGICHLFSEALANELRNSGVTVTCFCPGTTDTGFAARAGNDKSRLFKQFGAMTADKVALDGYHAVMAGRTLAISGPHNWLAAQSTRFAPRKMVTAISRWISEKIE